MQGRRFRIDEMAEDVQRAGVGIIGGDFDAGDEADAQPLGLVAGLLQAIARVVIRQGNAGEAAILGGADQFDRRKGAVGSGGMCVQVDNVHGQGPRG